MRKLLLLPLSLLLFSCSKDDDTNFIAAVLHEFEVAYSDDYNNQPAANAQLNLVNTDDGKNYSATTDAFGTVSLEIVPGTYKVNVTRTFTPEEYLDFSGQEVATDVTFNASLESLRISESAEASTKLELVTGRIGDLLIKQIYYSGSHARLGALYRDQFVEIHNNSNQTIFLDGLHLAQIYGERSTSSELEDYHLPNAQYDWSKSIGQPDPDNANSGYVYADEVLSIPGSGEEYPLESGESVIIAATAVNHKAPLTVTDEDGETVTYEVPEPERTVDLSNAPFEAYFRPFQESAGSSWLDSDVDNPNSANLDISFKSWGGKDLIIDGHGRDALVIFFADETEFSNWPKLPSPEKTEINEGTSYYLQIPNAAILDGVELQRTDPSKAKPKSLPDAIDAGDIATIEGIYTSESVIRKVKNQVDGKTFYQDTNNSSTDFQVLAHPEVVIE